jgi:hypothetical protein
METSHYQFDLQRKQTFSRYSAKHSGHYNPDVVQRIKGYGSKSAEKRTVTPDTPVLVEYTETDYCMSFGGIILEMISWGKQHREKVMKNSGE